MMKTAYPLACRLAKVFGVISPKSRMTTVVRPVRSARAWVAPSSSAIKVVSAPMPTLTSVLPSRSAERMRSGCFCHSFSIPARRPPASMSARTRASPSAVNAVSDEEKNADPTRAATRVIHCQVGTKAR